MNVRRLAELFALVAALASIASGSTGATWNDPTGSADPAEPFGRKDDRADSSPVSEDRAASSIPGIADTAPTHGASNRARAEGFPIRVRRYVESDFDTVGAASVKSIAVARSADTSGLVVAGEKTVRIGVGGEGGVAVDQTLRLDASGEIAPGVSLKAHLSDQQVPLGAEGSTEALRELDEVDIQVRTRRWDLDLGDQDWSLADGATPGATRRLRGVSTGWSPSWTARATAGSPKAQWMRMVFQGAEGRQEGWILPGPEGRARASVVPGSERVRVNGTLLQSGTDYSLRAAEGVLDFLPRRRISGNDRIEVEWQAAVLDYQRGLTAIQGRSADVAEGPRWETWALQEGDDPTRPLSFAVNRQDDSLLRLAGSDPSRARRSDSTLVPLPRSVDDVGFRLGWTEPGAFDVSSEVRATRVNANLASDIDPLRDGIAGAFDGTSRTGRSLSEGGTGLVGTSLVLRANDTRFEPVSGRSTSGDAAARRWNDEGDAVQGASWETSGGLSWEGEPGIGAWTDAGQRRDASALARRVQVKAGLDRGSRQILTEAAFARREEPTADLDRWWARQGISWPAGPFVPRIGTEAEDRQSRPGGSSITRDRWLAGQAGSSAKAMDDRLSADLAATARLDQSDHAGRLANPEDSARSRGARLESRWTTDPVVADGLLDGKLVERKAADGAWIPDQTWLGEAHVATRLHPGIETDARWLLSLSDFLPEIQVWDTVPIGTGTHKWDSISRQIIPADDGNLQPGGTRIDTSRGAIRSARRTLSLEATIQPGLVFEGLEGVLADVGLHGRGEWEQADSSDRIRFFPDLDDEGLAGSVEGRSSLGSDLWWARDKHRFDLSVQRDWIVAGTGATSAANRQRDLEWRGQYTFTSTKGHRLELPVRQRDRILSAPELSRRETVRIGEPLFSWHVAQPVEIMPSVLLASGYGHDGDLSMDGEVVAPALGILVRLGKSRSARSEIRYARASTTGPAGSNLSEGFLDGRTWRASAGLDWNLDRHFSAGADWVLRIDPGRDPFQKASAQARAVF